MSQNIQAVVPDDLAERVARAAEKEGRSVSSWVRRLLERELEVQSWSEGLPAKPEGLVSVPEAREQMDGPAPKKRPVLKPKGACPHPDVLQVKGSGGLIVKECRTCGERLLR